MSLSTSPLSLSPPLKTRSITIVVAALNEAHNLRSFLHDIDSTFDRLGFTLPVLLVNDGSTDDSREILHQLQQKFSFLTVIHHPRRSGLAGVLKTALKHTQSDWLYLTAADLESDIRDDLPLLLRACGPGVDAVAGWRQGRKDGKSIASSIANFFCRLAFGLTVHDMNWVKLIRRDLLTLLPLDRVTHRFILPVLAGWGCRVIEVPTIWYPRKAGKSNFGRKRLVTSAYDFWRLWWWFQTQGRLLAPQKRNA